MTQPFQYHAGELFCEELPLERIARQVGTPCYVYSETAVRRNFQFFRRTFKNLPHLVCYAVKANSNLSILDILRSEGSGFDVVSGGEIYRLRCIGADPAGVVFSGVGKSRAELEEALDWGIHSINVESLEELEHLEEIARLRGVPAPLSLRINPEVDVGTHPYVATGLRQHKFGIDMAQIPAAVESLRRSRFLALRGLGFHIGSQILEIEPFLEAFLKLKALAQEFDSQGLPLEHLSVGGGVGIPYRGEPSPDLDRYAEFLQTHLGGYRLLFEPGRFIVGNAGVLLNQVLYRKTNHGKAFVVVDGAMNDLIRPSLYQAFHEVMPLRREEPSITADVVGPVCESGDFFARDRLVADFRKGQYLALMNAGAYGFVAASNYNSRPRVPEVLVSEDRYRIVRTRETYDDLVRGEKD